MKRNSNRNNILITEDFTTNKVAATEFTTDVVDIFDSLIHFGKEGSDVTIQNCSIKDNSIVKCSPKDAYDFEVGALISLMRLCGEEKVRQASKEFFKASDTGATEKELELTSKLNDAKIYIADLKFELGYTMTKEEMDIVNILGEKDKEIDKLKKEIEYLKPRTWFADAMDNLGNVLKQCGESKVKEPPRKKLTKREKFWRDVKQNIKQYGGQWICVFPKDYGYFIEELEKELPEMRWGNGAKPSDNSWLSGSRYYIHLCSNKRMYFTDRPATDIKCEANKKVFTYRPENEK